MSKYQGVRVEAAFTEARSVITGLTPMSRARELIAADGRQIMRAPKREPTYVGPHYISTH